MTTPPRHAGDDDLTYAEVGATAGPLPTGYHHVRASRVVGHGRAAFERASDALLAGEVQRRSGAVVRLSQAPMTEGTEVRMRLGVGPFGVTAPCRVVWVERTERRCGFAYGTLPGHPEQGEERFVLDLDDAGAVTFTVTAFSRAARWYTRLGGPAGRLVQQLMTRRYLGALVDHDA